MKELNGQVHSDQGAERGRSVTTLLMDRSIGYIHMLPGRSARLGRVIFFMVPWFIASIASFW